MLLKLFFINLGLVFFFNSSAQKSDSIKIYNPYTNAVKDIDSVCAKAKMEKKQVLIQIGGNWCIWCIRLHKFIETNTDVKRKIDMDYVVYKLNYSNENKNEPLLRRFSRPHRFGFPVLLVLDSNGNLLHTQDTGLLEEKQGYSKQKIYDFLENWTIRAVTGL